MDFMASNLVKILAVVLLLSLAANVAGYISSSAKNEKIESLNKQLGQAESDIKVAQSDSKRLRADLALQNAEIQKWKTTADRAEQAGHIAVAKSVESNAKRKAFLVKIGSTPEDMNTWLSETFR